MTTTEIKQHAAFAVRQYRHAKYRQRLERLRDRTATIRGGEMRQRCMDTERAEAKQTPQEAGK